MSESVLLKFERDWADEFDMHGFRIMSKESWEKFKDVIEKIKYPEEFYFGTNEFFEFENSKDVLRSFKVINISESDRKILEKHFPSVFTFSVNFGWDPINQFIDNASDQGIDLGCIIDNMKNKSSE